MKNRKHIQLGQNTTPRPRKRNTKMRTLYVENIELVFDNATKIGAN
jgi:hypothetical protein